MSELLLVGNVLSKLYEIESEQNLFTAEGAQQYFSKYDSIVPEIHSSLDSLKILARDSYREEELDTIKLLIVKKGEFENCCCTAGFYRESAGDYPYNREQLCT